MMMIDSFVCTLLSQFTSKQSSPSVAGFKIEGQRDISEYPRWTPPLDAEQGLPQPFLILTVLDNCNRCAHHESSIHKLHVVFVLSIRATQQVRKELTKIRHNPASQHFDYQSHLESR